jgi:hypothetical protein
MVVSLLPRLKFHHKTSQHCFGAYPKHQRKGRAMTVEVKGFGQTLNCSERNPSKPSQVQSVTAICYPSLPKKVESHSERETDSMTRGADVVIMGGATLPRVALNWKPWFLSDHKTGRIQLEKTLNHRLIITVSEKGLGLGHNKSSKPVKQDGYFLVHPICILRRLQLLSMLELDTSPLVFQRW